MGWNAHSPMDEISYKLVDHECHNSTIDPQGPSIESLDFVDHEFSISSVMVKVHDTWQQPIDLKRLFKIELRSVYQSRWNLQLRKQRLSQGNKRFQRGRHRRVMEWLMKDAGVIKVRDHTIRSIHIASIKAFINKHKTSDSKDREDHSIRSD